jgi:hypothetical protein
LSARAAARLETLGFRHVYRYQPGKADWFAAGWPREGREANTQRVADTAHRDVPTCGINENVGALRDRAQARRYDVGVVVDENRVVLGLVALDTLDADPYTLVEQVMDPAPVTFRPQVGVGKLPEYVKTQHARSLVTTSDGVLIGLL